MKKQNYFQLVLLSSVMSGLSAQAALLGITPPANTPFYADFNDQNLYVNYAYTGSATSGTGTLEAWSTSSGITTSSTAHNTFTADNSSGAVVYNQGFNGYYDLTATIQNVNGVFSVQTGTVDIYGGLPTVNGFGNGSANTSDLLLSGNLKTGAQNFGYTPAGSAHSTASIELDLLFNVSSGNGSQMDNSQIFADYFGAFGGQGGIVLTTGALNGANGITGGYSGLAAAFSNSSLQNGQANTFVPEPIAYPVTASMFALFGLAKAAGSRRKQA